MKNGAAWVKKDVLIVGAGFAGASTAYHLSRSFGGSIAIIEREEAPGSHASGRNASLVLQSTTPSEIRSLVTISRRAYESHREDLGFHQSGSVLLGSWDALEAVRQPVEIPSEFRSPAQIRQQIPILQDHDFEGALWTPSDGVMDIARLITFYLDGARQRGVPLMLGQEVLAIDGSGPFRVTTSTATIECETIVNAAGAWCTDVAQLAGAVSLPIYALKRHLFVLDEVAEVSADMPFVWNLQENFYFRPESGGLLFSVCDEEPSTSLRPTVSTEISETLAEVIYKHLPSFREATQRKVWSCFRARSRDDRFVIGWDPLQRGLFWVAALGGHGVGASWEVGRIAAAAIVGNSDENSSFGPERLIQLVEE